MSFQPVIPFGGTAGWAFLKRTEATQTASFQRRPDVQRDEAYFRERIGAAKTADALVSDRRLLRISLEAFGLEADLNARAFIRRVLEEGVQSKDSLANRLADPRYAAMSGAFGFANADGPRSVRSDFADTVLPRWKERRFEAAIGSVNNDMRLAMNARRELAGIASGSGTETAKWLKVLGSIPLRTVVQGALGLPSSFAAIDLDRQVSLLEARMTGALGAGTVSQLADPRKLDGLIQRYLVSSAKPNLTESNPALALLQSGSVFRRV